jgi:hypothetical protein
MSRRERVELVGIGDREANHGIVIAYRLAYFMQVPRELF